MLWNDQEKLTQTEQEIRSKFLSITARDLFYLDVSSQGIKYGSRHKNNCLAKRKRKNIFSKKIIFIFPILLIVTLKSRNYIMSVVTLDSKAAFDEYLKKTG